MIGAGIFALVGQVAELAGSWVPWVFLAGAVVVGFSAYSYVRYSSTDPSSGGIAMLLKAAYGPGVTAGVFSLFMYVSMILAEGLLARTFGTYLLRPFGLQGSAVWVPVLAVVAIAAATVVNLVGNRWVERSATTTAVIKIAGIAMLAVAGIAATEMSSLSRVLTGGEDQTPPRDGWLGFLAGTVLCILAYKGFTTITNQGNDIRSPKRNIARSIVIAIAVCTVIYLLLTVAVAGSLSVPEIVAARDYALARAAEPFFGSWGVRLTVAVAVVATLSGLLASLFSARLDDMLRDMKQVPGLPQAVRRQSLLITATLAMLTAAFFDLSQIASLGAMLYLSMDIAIHWGLIRRLRDEVEARVWVPWVAIALDLLVLVPFVIMKFRTDVLTLVITVVVVAVMVLAQWFAVRRRDSQSTTGSPRNG
ncbi:APC family permease [Mycobacterium simiae]|uniref:APC family permease n=2 Tax=Mycobacterium simiae TaxID=1784 RepID=A0A5B1BSL4_MYCSI|nr:APC family permease [Mycobacterium simiae]